MAITVGTPDLLSLLSSFGFGLQLILNGHEHKISISLGAPFVSVAGVDSSPVSTQKISKAMPLVITSHW